MAILHIPFIVTIADISVVAYTGTTSINNVTMLMPVTATVLGNLLRDGRLRKDATVVEMGNQTYSVDGKTIRQVMKQIHVPEVIGKYDLALDRLEALADKKSARHPYDAGVPHARELYEAFGFVEYTAIDIEKSYESLVMDLNKDLQAEYGFTKRFSLVTNIGVAEHLFNQANFFKNAHDLTEEGGFMLHILPCIGHLNHGFFNFQPRLFDDLALANGYEVVMLSLAERDTIHVDLMKQTETTTLYPFHTHFLAKNRSGSLLIVALLRKVKDAPFVPPVQGKYFKELAGTGLTEYTHDTTSGRPVFTSAQGFYDEGTRPLSVFEKTRRKSKAALFRTVRVLGRYVLKA